MYFFLKDKNFEHRRQLTLRPKKTVDAWFIIGKQEVFFQRGLWGDFLKLYGSKRAEDPPPSQKALKVYPAPKVYPF